MELWHATTAQFFEAIGPVLPLPPKIGAFGVGSLEFGVEENRLREMFLIVYKRKVPAKQ